MFNKIKKQINYRKEVITEKTTLVKFIYYPTKKGTIEVVSDSIKKIHLETSRITSEDTFTSWRGLNADCLGNFNQVSKYRMKRLYNREINILPTYIMYSTFDQFYIDQARFIRMLKRKNLPISAIYSEIIKP